jgi:hypothetical protein
MADYSDPLGLLFGGVDYFGSPQQSKGLLQLTPQEIERMAAAQSPVFGVFPQMQPYRSKQDITASANAPVDFSRGRFAGTAGLFGDVVNQPIPMVRPLQLLSQALTGQQKYPDTEYFLENLPLKSDTPIGNVAGRIGSFAPINPMPAVRGVQKLGSLLGEEIGTRVATGRPLLPSLLQEPQTAMFAAPPAEQMSGGLLQAEVSPLGFYSAVEQQALKIPRKQGTGESFLNDLLKGQDVKKYEIEAMGLDTYLKGKPNVTRQEVQDFIQNNKISVEERQLGGAVTEDPLGISKRKEIFDKYEPEINALYKEMNNPSYVLISKQITPEEYQRGVVLQNRVYRGEPITAQEQIELDSILAKNEGSKVREFANNEEARNFLLAMSPEDRRTHMIQPKFNSYKLQNQIDNLMSVRDAEADAAYIIPERTPTKYDRFQLPLGENYRELLLKLPPQEKVIEQWMVYRPNGASIGGYASEEYAKKAAQEIGGTYKKGESLIAESGYRSGHWSDQNVLAHLRVNDRVDADGKKMLLIEEVQSDWHQEGREKGYKGKGTLTELPDNYFVQEVKTIDGDTMYVVRDNSNPSVIINKDYNRQSAINGVINELNASSAGGVPDAPFKDTWYQLALKRAIKEAVDKGYDRIGLTTGAQQAERYDLSKHIDKLIYSEPDANGLRKVEAITSSGDRLLGKKYTPQEIESNIGKEMADKINKSTGEFDERTKTYAMTGVDLKIGGEGMKKYYDEIYPNFLNKYGKKYGASVGETRIKTGRGVQGGEKVRYLDITPEMKKAVQGGQPLASVDGMAGLLT